MRGCIEDPYALVQAWVQPTFTRTHLSSRRHVKSWASSSPLLQGYLYSVLLYSARPFVKLSPAHVRFFTSHFSTLFKARVLRLFRAEEHTFDLTGVIQDVVTSNQVYRWSPKRNSLDGLRLSHKLRL